MCKVTHTDMRLANSNKQQRLQVTVQHTLLSHKQQHIWNEVKKCYNPLTDFRLQLYDGMWDMLLHG